MTLTEQYAEYAVKERAAKLSGEVLHHAKRAVIDWYACLLPGSVVAPATLLERAFAELEARLRRGDCVLRHRATFLHGIGSDFRLQSREGRAPTSTEAT